MSKKWKVKKPPELSLFTPLRKFCFDGQRFGFGECFSHRLLRLPGALTEEEVKRRGDAADEVRREMVRQARKKD